MMLPVLNFHFLFPLGNGQHVINNQEKEDLEENYLILLTLSNQFISTCLAAIY